ncbi:Tetratricopeptide repeat protein [anaerobic digester metagenome]
MEGQETKKQLLTLGNDCFDKGGYEDSASWYTQYLHLDPDNMGVKQDLGYCLYQLGRYEEALSWFLAIGHNRNSALTLVRIGKYEDALPFFEADLAEHPERYAIRFNYVSLLWYLRRFDEALSVYQAGPRLPPMTYMGLATTYRSCASEDFRNRNMGEDLTPPKMADILSYRKERIKLGLVLNE